MGKSHMCCAKTVVLGRLLMMDCPKHSLEYFVTGCFGRMNPVLSVVSGMANTIRIVLDNHANNKNIAGISITSTGKPLPRNIN